MIPECPQLQNLPANARKFWEEKERTLHDTLLRFSYTVCVEPADGVLREKSGLLYLMRQNLWFEDFPRSSAFSSLFQQSGEYTKTQVQIPLHAITEARLLTSPELGPELLAPRPSSGGVLEFFRLFKPTPTTLFLAGSDASEHAIRCAFRELDGPNGWYQTLSDCQK